MKKKLFDRWIEALESGEYHQVRSQLMGKTWAGRDGDEVVDGFCCLGVICSVTGVNLTMAITDETKVFDTKTKHDENAVSRVSEDKTTVGQAGLVFEGRNYDELGNMTGDTDGPIELYEMLPDFQLRYELAALNDGGSSFKEIAEWLRENEARVVTP